MRNPRAALLIWPFLCSAQEPLSPLYLAHDHARFARDRPAVAYQPSFARIPGRGLVFTWTAYSHGAERILSSELADGRMSAARQLSAGPGIYYQPVIAAGSGAAWAVWSRLTGGHWSVAGRRLSGGQWHPVTGLSPAGVNATRPAAVVAGGRLFAAWEQEAGRGTRIVMHDGVAVSNGPHDYRPSLEADERGAVWVFWDSYSPADRRYRVMARRVHPDRGPVETVSDGSASALKPVAISGGPAGLIAAWLGRRDVEALGILDQWYTIQAARLVNGKWERFGDVADLRHGLLPRVEPRVSALSGYQGERLRPMLSMVNGSVWLLWERKLMHGGGTETFGQLCGRRFDGVKWHDPVSLHEGLLDYRVAADRLTVVAKGMLQDYRVFEINPSQAKPLTVTNEQWPGWRTMDLPKAPPESRRSAIIDGTEFQLYWADLHVHSGLTPDAEGEPDELIHFARDAARIDAVVIQENDFYSRMLTEGEYRMGLHYSRLLNEPGRFLALAGYEWTHRQDDNRPNHRTAIFPVYDAPIVRHAENNANFGELCDVVEAAGGLMNTQHEVYRWSGRACDANIEVASGWRVFIRNPEKIHADLTAGAKAGFVATSDGHRRNPGTGGGLTGLYLRELTNAAVIEALREHRVFATNGSRIAIDARANGVFMGQALRAKGRVNLELKAWAPKPITRAVLIRDGAEIHVANGRAKELSFAHSDAPGRGNHWYYWRVEIEGESPDYPGNIKVAEGNLAWSSPHRVAVE